MPTMSATSLPRKRGKSISAKPMRAASMARRRLKRPRAWPRTASISCRSRCFRTIATERSAHAADQFLKQARERFPLLLRQAREDLVLVGNVGGDGLVDQSETLFGQPHD